MANTELQNYGIQNEGSDYRMHVSPYNNRVYVFETKEGIDLIKTKKYPLKEVPKGGYIITAKGYPVPIKDFKSLREYTIPDLLALRNIESLSTSMKGMFAEVIVKTMIHNQIIYLPIRYSEATLDQQLKGVDVILISGWKIQIKMDIPAYKYHNLFLQVAECNPYENY